MADLFDDLLALTAALDAAGVDYALCGGLAVAVHGAPRATNDIDLLVLPEGVDAALAAVEPLGFRFRAHPITFDDGMTLRRVTRIVDGRALTLDLLLVNADLHGVWASRTRIGTDGGELSVISRDALVEMKVRAGRTRDLADIERLTEDDR